ncbi:unnamed protein product [Spirodela intermedia]|uniref:Uncharacterized protein n=1 Tax=Spirodela intermedia TaxID=51605 RepID=A0A7I8KC28_SPIIN|nr:unnamed protein product [Spirodela intermedia]
MGKYSRLEHVGSEGRSAARIIEMDNRHVGGTVLHVRFDDHGIMAKTPSIG